MADGSEEYDSLLKDETIELAKQCALVAVDEMLRVLNHLPTKGYGMEYTRHIEYWEKVKQ